MWLYPGRWNHPTRGPEFCRVEEITPLALWSALNKFRSYFLLVTGFCADRLDTDVRKGDTHPGPLVLPLTWQEGGEERGPWEHANTPRERPSYSWFSVEMTEVAAFETQSLRRLKAGGEIQIAGRVVKARAHFSSISVAWPGSLVSCVL